MDVGLRRRPTGTTLLPPLQEVAADVRRGRRPPEDVEDALRSAQGDPDLRLHLRGEDDAWVTIQGQPTQPAPGHDLVPLPFDLRVEELPPLSESRALTAYLVVTEAVTNAIKHARAAVALRERGVRAGLFLHSQHIELRHCLPLIGTAGFGCAAVVGRLSLSDVLSRPHAIGLHQAGAAHDGSTHRRVLAVLTWLEAGGTGGGVYLLVLPGTTSYLPVCASNETTTCTANNAPTKPLPTKPLALPLTFWLRLFPPYRPGSTAKTDPDSTTPCWIAATT